MNKIGDSNRFRPADDEYNHDQNRLSTNSVFSRPYDRGGGVPGRPVTFRSCLRNPLTLTE